MFLGVRFGNARQVPAPSAGELEGIVDDPLRARACNDRRLRCDLDRQPTVRAPARSRVLPFGVLADDYKVKRVLCSERGGHVWIAPRRPIADVLVESLADREPQVPQ